MATDTSRLYRKCFCTGNAFLGEMSLDRKCFCTGNAFVQKMLFLQEIPLGRKCHYRGNAFANEMPLDRKCFGAVNVPAQDMDWNCGLVVCNYAVGGNIPSGDMYQVR